MAQWEENKHPRDDDGKFTSGGGTPAENKKLEEMGISSKGDTKSSLSAEEQRLKEMGIEVEAKESFSSEKYHFYGNKRISQNNIEEISNAFSIFKTRFPNIEQKLSTVEIFDCIDKKFDNSKISKMYRSIMETRYREQSGLDINNKYDAKIIEDMYKQHFSQWKKEIKKGFENGYAFAYSNDDRSEFAILINSSNFDDDIIPDLEYAEQERFAPIGCKTIRSLIDHELGHILDYEYNLQNDSVIDIMYRNYCGDSNKIKNDLSGYAAKDKREFIAEAWREYCNSPNPRSVAKKIGERIIAKSKGEK